MKMPLARTLLLWLVLMAVEVVHGVLRGLFSVPRVGDLPARQIGVFVGAGLIFAVTLAGIRWLNLRYVS